MSGDNVEIARRFYERLGGLLDGHWANPVPFEEWPGLDEAMGGVHLSAEWRPVNAHQPLRGREQWVRQTIDWIDSCEEWRVELEEVTDLGEDQALAVFRVSIRGKGSREPIDRRLFSVVTVANGMVTGISDYAELRDALEAAGS